MFKGLSTVNNSVNTNALCYTLGLCWCWDSHNPAREVGLVGKGEDPAGRTGGTQGLCLVSSH